MVGDEEGEERSTHHVREFRFVEHRMKADAK